MKIRGVFSSLVFGVAGCVCLVFELHVFAPLLGAGNVLALHLVGSAVVYAALIGSNSRAAIRNACVATIGAAAVLLLARVGSAGLGEVAVGLTLVVALVRSGLDPSARGPRSLVAEMLLGTAALAFAAWLAGPTWLGSAAALWGFVLVQSLYFLIPIGRRPDLGTVGGDPFDRARERLVAMLEEV